MIDVAVLQKYFAEETNPREFAENIHAVMADYVRLSCCAEQEADSKTILWNIDFLEELRCVVLKSEISECNS